MSSFARTDTSILGQWWWTVDRWILAATGALIAVGLLLSLAASPAVAERLGLDSYLFVKKHLALVPVGLFIMLGVSVLSPRGVRRTGLVVLLGAIVLILGALLFGAEWNGARRWISVAGFAFQPSEFLKPALVVVTAWMFSEQNRGTGVPGNWIACGLWAVSITLLMLQPDFGQAILITVTIGAMFFVAGMPKLIIIALGLISGVGVFLAYLFIPHVTSRVDRFFDPSSGDTYQVDKAINAFTQGGLFGRGPGEGDVKRSLPDAHTDYIFAVVGEEFGAVVCLLLVLLFAFIVLRGLARVFTADDHFVQLAASGLVFLFGLQALINMGVSLDLLPSKGMTLPFVSYGGSSLLALSLTMGMLLALLRKRAGVAIGGVPVGART